MNIDSLTRFLAHFHPQDRPHVTSVLAARALSLEAHLQLAPLDLLAYIQGQLSAQERPRASSLRKQGAIQDQIDSLKAQIQRLKGMLARPVSPDRGPQFKPVCIQSKPDNFHFRKLEDPVAPASTQIPLPMHRVPWLHEQHITPKVTEVAPAAGLQLIPQERIRTKHHLDDHQLKELMRHPQDGDQQECAPTFKKKSQALPEQQVRKFVEDQIRRISKEKHLSRSTTPNGRAAKESPQPKPEKAQPAGLNKTKQGQGRAKVVKTPTRPDTRTQQPRQDTAHQSRRQAAQIRRNQAVQLASTQQPSQHSRQPMQPVRQQSRANLQHRESLQQSRHESGGRSLQRKELLQVRQQQKLILKTLEKLQKQQLEQYESIRQKMTQQQMQQQQMQQQPEQRVRRQQYVDEQDSSSSQSELSQQKHSSRVKHAQSKIKQQIRRDKLRHSVKQAQAQQFSMYQGPGLRDRGAQREGAGRGWRQQQRGLLSSKSSSSNFSLFQPI